MSQVVALFQWSLSSIGILRKREISAFQLIITCAICITLFYNTTLWIKLFDRLEVVSAASLVFVATLLLLMVTINTLLLVFLVLPRIAKPALALLFVSCSLIAYFNGRGVVIDEQMVKTILQTDLHEASELLAPGLWVHLIFFGIVPACIVSRVNIRFFNPIHEVIVRLLVVGICLLFAFALLYENFRYSTYFGRENRDLRLYLNPAFPILAIKKAYASEKPDESTFQVLGGDARLVATKERRTVGIVVVGETARADHFELNGYLKATNPRLSKRHLLNFKMATACGTSTAYSVPCMFSFMNAESYDPDKALFQSNLLDVLNTAGVHTFWRDNNSSCKGVCERSASENFRISVDSASPHYNDGEYFDEILLSGLRDYIMGVKGDALIVLHQLGSHGPAYYKRYPKEFQKFTPACEELDPSQCDREAVNNSYDNTILYTDFIIDSVISILESIQEDADSFVLYASDHGESLGENGVYLHGLPRSIAPFEQIHVPFMLWLSPDLNREFGIDQRTSVRCATTRASHDNLSHTLLGLFQVQTEILNPNLNLLDNDCI
jgi:lipid A ethanolaminephosphotransferase